MRTKEPGFLELVNDKSLIAATFRRWQQTLVSGANFDGSIWWLPAERIAFSSYGDGPPDKLNRKVALGTDPMGGDWAVQINIPNSTGTENPLSGIGRSATGQLYLLRQGRLQGNNQSELIVKDFSARTGLIPASVLNAGKPTTREWYVVTPIHEDGDGMRLETGRFVDACSFARTLTPKDTQQADADTAELNEKLGKDEAGGQSSYKTEAGEVIVRRRQGEVWKRLKIRLAKDNVILRKPRHAKGYEVDGEVRAKDGSGGVLIEIKTSCSAADVYTGTGQLKIYPHLLNRLAGHHKVLLIPEKPAACLMDALASLDIDLHIYSLGKADDWSTATFSSTFLKLCGATGKTA